MFVTLSYTILYFTNYSFPLPFTIYTVCSDLTCIAKAIQTLTFWNNSCSYEKEGCKSDIKTKRNVEGSTTNKKCLSSL